MQMYLKFEPVSTTNPSDLIIYFEDLDLIGANDPSGFLESVEVFGSDGVTSITGLIDNIANDLVTADADTFQTVAIPLGLLTEETFFARLDFLANSTFKGINTPEYLIAEIHPVPLPAALPLFGAGLGILGFVGWRRRRQKMPMKMAV